ncbi:helix-turn-helix domain-containing protein [Microbacterium sp. SLBN-146]|uniref:AraC family transcriptional regulator n=1 Tax=Microbacterium sp. SLBN-146 TaxID=2768457 RepID=UPI00114FF22A|nr:helix-turn-helix domain-containing protein [Microbacterium sp. SLBN-146]TQJ30575.1 AraC-like DNA-binding protein [Microbacterium sp. SLBN-146]
MSGVLREAVGGVVDVDPRVTEEWIAALDGRSPAAQGLIEHARAHPGRVIGTAPIPGRVDPAHARATASVLTVALGDVRLSSGRGGAASWSIPASEEPSVLFVAPLRGRLRVRRGDQVVLLAPPSVGFVTDDMDVVIDGSGDEVQLLVAMVPVERMRGLARELALRGPTMSASSPEQRATISYLGTLLIAGLVDEQPPSSGCDDTVATLVSALAESTLAAAGRRSRATEVRQAALRSIDRHHRESTFGVDEIARELHMSRRQLYRAFPDAGGIAGMIAQRRLQTAERLMRDQPGLQLSEVAARSGFSTPGVMRGHFRRVFGTTPGRHRDGGQERESSVMSAMPMSLVEE